jgi:hypothetical protein
MTSSKSTKLSENVDMGDVLPSVKILKNSTWIPLDSTHIKSEFFRRRMTSLIPRRRHTLERKPIFRTKKRSRTKKFNF